MAVKTAEKYLQCPYCHNHEIAHAKRVPKTAGKYRIKIVYGNVLTFKCSKCGRTFKVEINPQMILWEFMKQPARDAFNKVQYKKYKGGLNKNEERI